MIAIERSGDVEDSENIIFVMTKNNCDRVLQFFELFTLSVHPDLTKLLDKEIELSENGHSTTGMVHDIYPYKNITTAKKCKKVMFLVLSENCLG